MSARPSAGTCFGFAVHSSLPFAYLREGPGEPMEVSTSSVQDHHVDGAPIMAWTPTTDLPLEGRLYRAGQGFRLWIADAGWFTIDTEAPAITLPETADVIRREERLWSIPAMLCFLARGDVPLHAAAVEVNGGAVVLAAPRAHGKTTLAAALHSAGHRLLSEDVTCVRPGKVPMIIPGPAMLRVRRDVAERLVIRNASPVGVPDDRVHFAVDQAARGDCRPVPLRAIFLLRSADDGVRVEAVPWSEAVRELWPLSSRFPTRNGHAQCFQDLVDIAGRVPVWNLHRPLTFEALPTTVDFIAGMFQR